MISLAFSVSNGFLRSTILRTSPSVMMPSIFSFYPEQRWRLTVLRYIYDGILDILIFIHPWTHALVNNICNPKVRRLPSEPPGDILQNLLVKSLSS